MSDIKFDFQNVTRNLWKRLFLGTKGEILESLELLSPDCVITRPGQDHFSEGKTAFLSSLDTMLAQRSHFKMELSDYWSKLRRLDSQSALVYGGCQLCGKLEKNNQTFCEFTKPIKFMAHFHHNGSSWKIVSLNQMVPYEEQAQGEFFPMALSHELIESRGKVEELTALAKKHEQESKIATAIQVALQMDTPAQTLRSLLEEVGHIFQAERVFVCELSPQGSFQLTEEWVTQGCDRKIALPASIAARALSFWDEDLQKNNTIIGEDILPLKERSPEVYRFLSSNSIHSFMVSPLYDKELRGMVGVINQKERIHGMSDVLYVLASYVGGIVQYCKLVEELEALSYQDQMTDFGNRHAIRAKCMGLSQKTSLGILFADVTGLKLVNDSRGHDAGDALILRCCAALREVFPAKDCFRIGGDELLILCDGISEEAFSEKVLMLRRILDEKSLSLAIGTVWEAESNNIELLVARAEQAMYLDKNEYYRRTGLERRNR